MLHNKYAVTGQYSSWILSEFIQSFLWKLQGQNITSRVFSTLAEKEPNLKFNFNDQIGRINKFRFWALYTIIDGEFTSFFYYLAILYTTCLGADHLIIRRGGG